MSATKPDRKQPCGGLTKKNKPCTKNGKFNGFCGVHRNRNDTKTESLWGLPIPPGLTQADEIREMNEEKRLMATPGYMEKLQEATEILIARDKAGIMKEMGIDTSHVIARYDAELKALNLTRFGMMRVASLKVQKLAELK